MKQYYEGITIGILFAIFTLGAVAATATPYNPNIYGSPSNQEFKDTLDKLEKRVMSWESATTSLHNTATHFASITGGQK